MGGILGPCPPKIIGCAPLARNVPPKQELCPKRKKQAGASGWNFEVVPPNQIATCAPPKVSKVSF